MFGRRKVVERIEEDPTGKSQAVRDFNGHEGPARLFYNRSSRTFFVQLYKDGAEKWWTPQMCDCEDKVELYRKTTPYGDVKITSEELDLMEREIVPYKGW
jgi:hypothetical protein